MIPASPDDAGCRQSLSRCRRQDSSWHMYRDTIGNLNKVIVVTMVFHERPRHCAAASNSATRWQSQRIRRSCISCSLCLCLSVSVSLSTSLCFSIPPLCLFLPTPPLGLSTLLPTMAPDILAGPTARSRTRCRVLWRRPRLPAWWTSTKQPPPTLWLLVSFIV